VSQTLTLVTLAAVAVVVAWGWKMWRRRSRETVAVSVRLDRSAPGAHLMWDIANAGDDPITVTKLIIHTKERREEGVTVPLAMPQLLRPQEGVLLPTDVDWTLLAARSIAVGDAAGREHVVSRDQLTTIQEQLRGLIDRREDNVSARDWLFVGTDLAFGVVILGLGFFLLMWVIATG
jgi:hypothetical protein